MELLSFEVADNSLELFGISFDTNTFEEFGEVFFAGFVVTSKSKQAVC